MNHRMLKWIVIALLAVLLAACGGATAATPIASPAPALATVAPAAPTATAPTSTAMPATNASAATAVPAPAATAAPPTAAQNGTAQPSGGLRTFTIVPAQTEASYAVQEQFLNRDLPNQAIGTTNAVTGAFQFTADGTPTGQVTNITVDLRTLTSDERKRDQRIHTQWLESDTYPFATFVSTGVSGVPDSYTEGQTISFKLSGNMTIHDVTKPVTFDVTGTLAGDTVTGTATTQILMKDFGFDPPSVAGILTVKDGVTVTVNFTAAAAA